MSHPDAPDVDFADPIMRTGLPGDDQIQAGEWRMLVSQTGIVQWSAPASTRTTRR